MRVLSWLRSRLAWLLRPGPDPVFDADAEMWEEHQSMVPKGSKMDGWGPGF